MSEPGKPAGHAFISYVREDSRRARRLQRTLEAAGIPVWRDTAKLWPGQDWRAIIRHAITDNALVFIACFSRSSVARAVSYQNEELAEAIEQLRLRRPEDPWLIPVRFDECDIPDRDIGGGRTLASLQRADLFGGKAREDTTRLVAAIVRILDGGAGQSGLLDRSRRRGALAAWLGRRRRGVVPAAAVAVTVVAVVLTMLLAPDAGTGRPPALPRGNQRAATRNGPSSTPTPRPSSAPNGAARLIAASFLAPGSQADALAFDGKDLWTSDNSDSIFQVDLNGQVDASYQAPDPTPEGLTWDGHSFWVFTTNQGLIDHFQITNGRVERLGSINPHAQVFGGDITHNLAWAHGDLWWAEQYNIELLSTHGAVIRKIAKGSNVLGLAWDGSHLWLAYDNFPDGSRIEEDTATGTPIRTFTVPITTLTSLTWADGTLWASGQHDLASPVRIYRLNVPPT